MPLADVLAAVRGGWRALRGRSSYRALSRYVVGSVKALEVTYGANGWHPHIHVLLFVDGASQVGAERAVGSLLGDWIDLVGERLGGVAPSVEHALDARWIGSDAAAYVSKVGKEMALSDSKSGRDPFQLLDVRGEGAQEAGARFIEYAVAMKGAQSLVWSPGLRNRLEVGVEPTDEELLWAEESGRGGVLLAVVPAVDWNRLVAYGQVDSVLAMIGAGWCPDEWRPRQGLCPDEWWPRRE